MPQITVNARQPDFYSTDSAFFGQYTDFVRPDASTVEGQRTVMQPQISIPYVTPGWYVTPRLGVNVTHYALSYPGSANVLPTSINRNLPIFSVDSGMTFERPSNWFGRDYTQTLEPRLYYLNIPYEDQNDIPIFDTALADFNFAQIFADNQFSGWDRINNANQLTAALSSRLIDPASGSEIMRGMIGQRLYFTDDKVALPGATTREWGRSDFLAGFTGQVLPRVYADAALQYDVDNQQTDRFSIGTRYFPAAGKLVNASYSYNPQAVTPIKQVDISGQWPINGRLQAVGRYNYSFLQKQPIEIIGGLEYNAGCWVVRVVGQRLQTTEADATTRAFVQLELSDFSRLGSSPINLLQRRIPGYGVANQPQTDSALAEQ
jgi:LPS-assembly protein